MLSHGVPPMLYWQAHCPSSYLQMVLSHAVLASSWLASFPGFYNSYVPSVN